MSVYLHHTYVYILFQCILLIVFLLTDCNTCIVANVSPSSHFCGSLCFCINVCIRVCVCICVDREIVTEKEFLELTTTEDRCVVHFYHTDFRRCDIMHTHLEVNITAASLFHFSNTSPSFSRICSTFLPRHFCSEASIQKKTVFCSYSVFSQFNLLFVLVVAVSVVSAF